MSENIGPCLHCGKNAGELRRGGKYFWVTCNECNSSGGEKTTADEAIALWNGPDPWRPIAEAPKDGNNLLLLDGCAIVIGYFDSDWGYYTNKRLPEQGQVFHPQPSWVLMNTNRTRINPTHFQPLPAGPRKGTK